MKFTLSCLSLLLVIFNFSCKKKEEPKPDDKTEPEPSPAAVYIRAKAVDAGSFFSMTLRQDATLKNIGYMVGSGNNLGGITQVEGGDIYCCVLRNDSTVWSWGRNTFGQLGDSTNVDKSLPVKMTGIGGVKAISVGYRHTLMLKTDGTVWACGENDLGQLGDSTFTDRYYPVKVKGLTNVVAVSAGANHSLALRSDGTIWAWGQFCGPGTSNTNSAALYVFGTPGEITSISGGVGYSMFLKNDGTVWGWGSNLYGQLGPNNTGSIFGSVIQVTGISNVTNIAAGFSHSLAIRNDSTVWAWGTNTHGELGDGTQVEKHSPVQVSGLNKIVAVAAGYYHSIALSSDEKVWTWGWNNGDQLGVPNTTIMERLTPKAVVE